MSNSCTFWINNLKYSKWLFCYAYYMYHVYNKFWNRTHRIWVSSIEVSNSYCQGLVFQHSDLKISMNEGRCSGIPGHKHPNFGESSLCRISCPESLNTNQVGVQGGIGSERLGKSYLSCLGIDGEHGQGVSLACDVVLELSVQWISGL